MRKRVAVKVVIKAAAMDLILALQPHGCTTTRYLKARFIASLLAGDSIIREAAPAPLRTLVNSSSKKDLDFPVLRVIRVAPPLNDTRTDPANKVPGRVYATPIITLTTNFFLAPYQEPVVVALHRKAPTACELVNGGAAICFVL